MTDSENVKQLRKEALLYFGSSGPANGVIEHFEEATNKLFKEKPYDLFGYLANYFEQLAFPPKISKIESRVCLDSRGLPTTSVDLYFFHKNSVKLVSTFESPISFQFVPLNLDDLFDEKHWIAVNQSVECINAFVSNILTNLNPLFQLNIDEAIRQYFCNRMKECMEPKIAGELIKPTKVNIKKEANSELVKEQTKEIEAEKPKDKKEPKKDISKSKVATTSATPYEEPHTQYPSCMLGISAVSQSICYASSVLSNKPLYEHINYAFTQQHRETYKLTTPIFTLLSSGKQSNGKVKCCKEYLLFPSPKRPINQVIWEINKICNFCWKNINSKTAMAWCTSEMGALNASFEKVEQGVELLVEAIKAIGLKPGSDYFLGINAVASDYYNLEKEKYEPIQGVMKSGAEMSKFWSDLIKQYPFLIYLVDPLIKKDEDHWVSLCREISECCFVIGGQIFEWANELRTSDNAVTFPASGIELKMNDFDTVSDIYCAAQKFKEFCKEVVLVYSLGDANSSFIIDMSLALGCRFVRIGGLTRGEKTLKMNRLIQTRDHLISQNKSCVDKRITFAQITLPPTQEGTAAAAPPPAEEKDFKNRASVSSKKE